MVKNITHLFLFYNSFLKKKIFSINAGCAALPALLNIKHVMKQRKVDGIWKAKDELPVS